ncbi:MAG: hypothetical protein QXT64_02730 [Desulfurococcaceae archaeon]
MPDSIVRISSEAKKLVEEIASRTNRSVSQLVSEAIFRTYLGVDKVVENAVDKKITDIKTETFKAKSDKLFCSICKRQINKDEIVTVITVHYDDNTVSKTFYCYSCYMSETISDEKLLSLEKKLYELRRVKRLLESEKKKLLDEVGKLEKILYNLTFLHEVELLVRELLNKQNLTDEDKKRIFEFEKKLNELHVGTKILVDEILKKHEKKQQEYEKYEKQREVYRRW